jgi:tetratricopeptide (TPR) repeat protein
VWWSYFTKKLAEDDAGRTMKRVRSVVEGRIAEKEFHELIEDAISRAKNLPEDQRERTFLGLADTCREAGDDTHLKECLEAAVAVDGSPLGQKGPMIVSAPTSYMKLADYYASKKDWTKAAQVYGRAWDKDRKEPLPAYLRGMALIEAGVEREGKRLIDLAHDLPLADAATRFTFARELERRGHGEAARLECELIVRINSLEEPWYTEEALKALAQEARRKKDYAKAADYYERSLVCHFRADAEFRQTSGNLVVPSALHHNRALAALAADQIDAMKAELQMCLDALPGDINVPVALLPELEKRGRKKEAADLFQQYWGIHESFCKDHPKSAWGHNNLAWLGARCRRNLDEALKHAQEATELAPEYAGYLDTLAEVHFQRGEKEKALEVMKKCVALEPRYAYFRKQFKRFEAGDPNADLPD